MIPWNRRLPIGAALLLCPSALCEDSLTEPDLRLEITARVYNSAGIPDDVLERAQTIATQIFEHAAIQVIWTGCPTSDEERELYPDCSDSFSPRDLILRLLPTAPAQFAEEKAVFGVARMSAGNGFARFADIYFDRVEPMIWNKLRSPAHGIFATQMPLKNCRALVLGVALAHEMGHLLLGTQSHSNRGIMRANWSRPDLRDAYLGRQRFTPSQENRLRAGVRARSSECPLPDSLSHGLR